MHLPGLISEHRYSALPSLYVILKQRPGSPQFWTSALHSPSSLSKLSSSCAGVVVDSIFIRVVFRGLVVGGLVVGGLVVGGLVV